MSEQEEKRGCKRKRPVEVVVEEKEEVEESSHIDDASVCQAPPTADMTEVSSNDQQQEELLKMDNRVPIDIEEVLKSSGMMDDQFMRNIHELLTSSQNKQLGTMASGQQPLRAAVANGLVEVADLVAIVALIPGAIAAAMPGAIAAAIAPLSAQLSNIPIRAYNKGQHASRQIVLAVPGPCRRPLKVEAGNGAGLPGMPVLPVGGPAVLAVAAAGAAAPVAVGAIPLGVGFPATDMAIDSMNHADLQVLSIVYNETFNIVAGDDLGQRRDKFRAWLCY
jgi:hypothetical protein